MSKSRVGALTLLMLFALITCAYGASVSWDKIVDQGKKLNVENGTQYTIEQNNKNAHFWDVIAQNGSSIMTGAGNKLTFTAMSEYGTPFAIKLTEHSSAGCIGEETVTADIIPEEQKIRQEDYTVTETRTRDIPYQVTKLLCGISGPIVVGPNNISETYTYTGGYTGIITYEWKVDGSTIIQKKDAASVSDLPLDWSKIGKDFDFAGQEVGVSLNLSARSSVANAPAQRQECSLPVKVYPPLEFNITGNDVVCSNNSVQTYEIQGIPTGELTQFNWSIDGNALGGNEANIEIDFSDKSFGFHEIALAVERTTPDGLIIEGAQTKKVNYDRTPLT